MNYWSGDGIVVRGQAYGVRSIRVDGNDALAVFSAVHTARKMAISESRPVLIEVSQYIFVRNSKKFSLFVFFGFELAVDLQALTYRAGHHSTSDDSSKYRPIEEIEWWRAAQDPVARLRKWLEGQGWWTSQSETEFRDCTRREVRFASARSQLNRNLKPKITSTTMLYSYLHFQ